MRQHATDLTWVRWDRVALVLLSLAGGLLLLSITAINSLWAGALEMTPDSVQYIAAAQNILAGNGYLRYEGLQYVAWPPLYSSVIALLYSVTRFLTTDVIYPLRYLHVLLFMILIFSSGLLFFRYVRSRVIALIGTAAVIVSPALYVSHLVWSDEIFSLLIVIFLLVMAKLLERPSIRLLIISAILAALIVLQRYAGIVVVFSGGVMLLWFMHRVAFWRRVKYVLIFGFISIAPITLWMARNYILTSRLTGNRSPSQRPLLENMGTTLDWLQNWFIPHNPIPLAPVVVSLIVIIMGVVAVSHYRRSQGVGFLATLERIVPLPVSILVIVYILFLNIVLSVYDQGAISIQYLMPVYIPLLVLLCSVADAAAVLPWGKRWIKPLVVIWIVAYVMPSSFSEVNRLTQHCCPIAWRNSELIDWLEKHANELRKPIYANTPLSQYRGVPVRDLPRKLDVLTRPLTAYSYEPPDSDGYYLVWYKYLEHGRCPKCYTQEYTFEEYRSLFNLSLVVERSDGAIYLVTAK